MDLGCAPLDHDSNYLKDPTNCETIGLGMTCIVMYLIRAVSNNLKLLIAVKQNSMKKFEREAPCKSVLTPSCLRELLMKQD